MTSEHLKGCRGCGADCAPYMMCEKCGKHPLFDLGVKWHQKHWDDCNNFIADVETFNTLSRNCGLQSTMLERITLLYCITSLMGMGTVHFVDKENRIVKWCIEAYKLHQEGKCDDDKYPDEHHFDNMGLCPFCEWKEKMEEGDDE